MKCLIKKLGKNKKDSMDDYGMMLIAENDEEMRFKKELERSDFGYTIFFGSDEQIEKWQEAYKKQDA